MAAVTPSPARAGSTTTVTRASVGLAVDGRASGRSLATDPGRHRGRASPTRELGGAAVRFEPPFVLAGRATGVPHQTDNSGIERTTTVTSIRPLRWRLALLLLERILRMCLIRMRSQMMPALDSTCGRPPAALRPGNDTTVTGVPASPSPKALASPAGSTRVSPDRETYPRMRLVMYRVGIDQGANHKKLKRLQNAGVVVLCQAHDLEVRRSHTIQQGRPFKLGVSELDGIDGLADEKWDDTIRIFGKSRQSDAEHLYSCYLNRVVYFITEDRTDFITGGRREQLEALLGVKIRRTEESLDELRAQGVDIA
jgi:hypothetical protein